jgi:general secretion pathway protein J
VSLNNKSGFTLLEIVIALSLSVVIMVILFAALRLGYKSQDKGNDRAEMTQRMRILNDRITWLIRGTYPFLIKKTDLQKIFFRGDSESIGFVTSSVDSYGKGPEDLAGLKWVEIFADNKGLQIREKVFFLEDVFDKSGGKEFVLDPGVRKIEFEYFDLPEDETTGEWVSDWDPDDKKYFPSAVKFKITFEHNGKTIEMPETIVRINVWKKMNP